MEKYSNDELKSNILKSIKNCYLKNRMKSFILSEKQLKEKVYKVHFFSKGDIWTGWYSLKLIFNKYDGQLLKNGIFGLISGIYIYQTYIVFIKSNKGDGLGEDFELNLLNLKKDYSSYFSGLYFTQGNKQKLITNEEKEFLLELFQVSDQIITEDARRRNEFENSQRESKRIKKEIEEKRIEEKRKIREKNEIIRKEKLELLKLDYIATLDKDGNGEIDLIDIESFTKLLNLNQKKIIQEDKVYIQNFVKISSYLKTKRTNIQNLFHSIKNTSYENELEELVGLLKNQVYTYELLVFNSINMVVSLVDSEYITFYEIYECFDQLGVFNSNWETEVFNNLEKINNSIEQVNLSIIKLNNNISRNLHELMYSIYHMENKIVNSVSNLSYVTQDSFRNLTFSVEKQLGSIDSSIKFNNLLTGIQTYQMYKINQNTKRIG